MYHKFFGLQEIPFSLSPDTSYFFAYGHYNNALNTLLIALRTGEGFIKVSGEVGTGKTLLCRKLMSNLENDFEVIYIPNPQLSAYGLQVALAEELGIKVSRYVHRLQKDITDRLIQINQSGKRVVLCLDEAQAMPEETIESLRLLTNIETEKFKLLQVVMFGQPELNSLLSRQSVRQLKQRITFAYDLQPIDRQGMGAYILHRLYVAGYANACPFEERALDRIYRASRGIPRLINILCHKSMLLAYGLGVRYITLDMVNSAIKDTEDAQSNQRNSSFWQRLFHRKAAA